MIHPLVAALATIFFGVLVGFFVPVFGIIVAIGVMGACIIADQHGLHDKKTPKI